MGVSLKNMLVRELQPTASRMVIFKRQLTSNCFFSDNILKSCRFDENVHVVNTIKPLVLGLMPCATNFKSELQKNHISSIYQGIEEGYLAGEIFNRAREYFFKQRQRPILDSTAFPCVVLFEAGKHEGRAAPICWSDLRHRYWIRRSISLQLS
jgi:hypothetical protein